jgi:hypothetical protein
VWYLAADLLSAFPAGVPAARRAAVQTKQNLHLWFRGKRPFHRCGGQEMSTGHFFPLKGEAGAARIERFVENHTHRRNGQDHSPKWAGTKTKAVPESMAFDVPPFSIRLNLIY